MISILVELMTGVMGFVFGALCLPLLSDITLRWKYHRMNEWWQRGKACYITATHDNAADLSKADTDTVKTWRNEVRRSILNGTITKERVAELAEVGFNLESYTSFNPNSVEKTEELEAKRYSFTPTRLQRALCGLVFFLLCFALAATPMPPAFTPVLLLAFVVVGVIVICDLRAHVIPTELVLVLCLLGIIYRFLLGGLEGVGVGLLVAAVIWIASRIANLLTARFVGGASAIGAGDVRLMVVLAVLCGFRGSIIGALAAYGTAALVCIALAALKKLKLHERIPMAPFLALWAVVGVATTLSPYYGGI